MSICLTIKGLPGMTARRKDGEYRVTFTPPACSALGVKADDVAYYTTCPIDALDTATSMSRNLLSFTSR